MQDTDLAVVLERTDLSEASRHELVTAFGPSFVAARSAVVESAAIVVTDATQVSEMKAARAARLKLRTIRVGAENTRKELKAESLKRGREIDNVAKMIATLCEPEEARLEDAEKFAERAEAARRKALAESRAILIAPYGVDVQFVDLGGMPESTWATFLEQARTAHDAKIAAEAKAKAEAEAAAKAAAEEQARIRAENERLRLEAVEREKAAKAERERMEAEQRAEREKARKEREAAEEAAAAQRRELEAKARAEREAREKVEAEQRAERERAEREAKAKALAAKKAAAAPDREKLMALADALDAMDIPKMATDDGKRAMADVVVSIRNASHNARTWAASM